MGDALKTAPKIDFYCICIENYSLAFSESGHFFVCVAATTAARYHFAVDYIAYIVAFFTVTAENVTQRQIDFCFFSGHALIQSGVHSQQVRCL